MTVSKQYLPLRTGRMHRHLKTGPLRMGKRFCRGPTEVLFLARQPRVPLPPLASCVTLGRLLKLSEPQFLICKMATVTPIPLE